MSKLVSYRPAEGRRALRPNGEPLRDSGEPLVMTPYWARLLADGDIKAVPTIKSRSPRHKPASPEGSKSE